MYFYMILECISRLIDTLLPTKNVSDGTVEFLFSFIKKSISPKIGFNIYEESDLCGTDSPAMNLTCLVDPLSFQEQTGT